MVADLSSIARIRIPHGCTARNLKYLGSGGIWAELRLGTRPWGDPAGIPLSLNRVRGEAGVTYVRLGEKLE